MEQKQRLLLFPILTTVAIAGAIFLNTQADKAGNIAIVSSGVLVPSFEFLNVTLLDESPPLSELVAGKYDAVIAFDEQGGYEIQTFKSDEYRQMLEAVIEDPTSIQISDIGVRGNGTNIIGFIMMFVLMQGASLMFMFAEDKEKKQIHRIAASPVSFVGYLFAYSFFCFAFLFIATAVMLGIAFIVPGVDMGFGFFTYLSLIALLCALSTSFGLFLVSLFKSADTSNMASSASVVLTSVLAGSFYSFDKGNGVLAAIIKILPQKAVLSLSESLEQGLSISSWFSDCAYVFVLIAIFMSIAVTKTRKDYMRR